METFLLVRVVCMIEEKFAKETFARELCTYQYYSVRGHVGAVPGILGD